MVRFLDLNADTLSMIVAYLSPRDARSLTLVSRSIHPIARGRAMSTIKVRTPGDTQRILRFFLADVPNRLLYVKSLTVLKGSFGHDWENNCNLSYVQLLAEVLEQAMGLRFLRLDEVDQLFTTSPRVVSALRHLRAGERMDLHLEGVTTAAIEVVASLTCMPHVLTIANYNTSNSCNATLLLRSPVLQKVRLLTLCGLEIEFAKHNRGSDSESETRLLADAPASPQNSLPLCRWPGVRELRMAHSIVLMETLTTCFPCIRTLHINDRYPFRAVAGPVPPWMLPVEPEVRLRDWSADTYETGLEASEDAHWDSIDHLYSSTDHKDLIRWNVNSLVRWLMLEAGGEDQEWKVLPAVRRTRPVVFSLLEVRLPMPEMFWRYLAGCPTPRLRYLDLAVRNSIIDSTAIMAWMVSAHYVVF